jgi:hypothetical protein
MNLNTVISHARLAMLVIEEANARELNHGVAWN